MQDMRELRRVKVAYWSLYFKLYREVMAEIENELKLFSCI